MKFYIRYKPIGRFIKWTVISSGLAGGIAKSFIGNA